MQPSPTVAAAGYSSASILAWGILGQTIGWQVGAGGAAVLAGGALVVLYSESEPVPLEVPQLAEAVSGSAGNVAGILGREERARLGRKERPCWGAWARQRTTPGDVSSRARNR